MQDYGDRRAVRFDAAKMLPTLVHQRVELDSFDYGTLCEQFQPQLRFICFFQHDADPRDEFLMRARPTRASVVGCHATSPAVVFGSVATNAITRKANRFVLAFNSSAFGFIARRAAHPMPPAAMAIQP